MKSKISIFLSLGFAIFILSIFYFSLTNEKMYNTQGLVNKKIDDFLIKELNTNSIIQKESLKVSDFVLVNFWASWCAPCRLEHRYLMTLKNEKEIRILGINYKDKKTQALTFLKDLGNPYYLVGEDDNGKISVQFGVYGIPESILLNKEMKIIKKFIGPINEDNYNTILKIIKKK